MLVQRRIDEIDGDMIKGEHTAKHHTQIRTPPEEISESSATGKVPTQPTDIGNRTFFSNIRKTSLVGVLEGSNLLSLPELFLQLPDLREDFVSFVVVLGLGLGIRQFVQISLNLIGLRHGVEKSSKERSLLTGYLRGGSVVGNSAVADSPDVLRAIDNEEFVNGKAATRFLLGWDLVDQVLYDGADSVTRSPDKKAIRNLFNFLGSIWMGDFGFEVLVSHVFDHSLRTDSDGLFLEGRFSVIDQLLGEHGKDLGSVSN